MNKYTETGHWKTVTNLESFLRVQYSNKHISSQKLFRFILVCFNFILIGSSCFLLLILLLVLILSLNLADTLNKLIRLRIISTACHCRIFVQSILYARPYICYIYGNDRHDTTKAPEQENPTKHNQYLSNHQPMFFGSIFIHGEVSNALKTNPEALNNG